MHGESHLTDEELVLGIDNELDGRQAEKARAHLAHCSSCRERRGKFEGAIAEYVQLHRSLGARMATPRESVWQRLAAPAFVCVAAGVIAVLGFGLLTMPRTSAGPLPDSRLTPGAARLISRDQVCSLPADDGGLSVSSDQAMRVFGEYKISFPSPKTYEVDFLISPALGGANDIRNLWPQPYTQGVWNSRVKDALEDHLRRLVCEGKIDVPAAQHEIASDWIAAYRKYFRTNEPVAAHALFVKDRPWE